MAIEVFSNVETPTATTVESYEVNRVGQHLTVRMAFAETVEVTDGNGNPVYNDLGIAATKRAKSGCQWELLLTSANEQHAVRMQQMLGAIYFKVVKAWLTKIGDATYTDADILNGIMSLAGDRISIDDFITSEVENIEKDRRTEVFIPYFSGGQLP
jgi:flagellar biosynthesis regulator FlaF